MKTENTKLWSLHQATVDSKVIKQNQQHPHQREKIYIADYSLNDIEELAFMERLDYANIFGVTNINERNRSKMAIVKITNPTNGKSIHRLYRTSNSISGYKQYVVLSFSSIMQITRNEIDFNSLSHVYVSRGSALVFLWNHPNIAAKLTVRFGIVGIAITILFSILGIII